MGTQQSQAPLISQSQAELFDFYRASLKATGSATRVSLEGTVRLRTTQLRVIDEALAEHARLTAQIDAAKGLEDLLAVSGKLAGAQYQTLISYWGAIYEAIGENQVEVARLVESQAEQIHFDLQGTLGTAPGNPVPVLAALQPLMEVASSAYALTARATAEATKLAAAHLATTEAASVQPGWQAEQRSA
jgi:hypothetical protein